MTNIKYERVKQTIDHEPQNEEIELESEAQMRSHSTSKGHPYVVTSRSGAAAGPMGAKRRSFAYTIIVTLLLILCYFTLSIGLTFYQRLLLQEFRYPLTVVVYHLCFKLVMSAVIRWMYRIITKKPRIMLDWRTSVRKILPSGLASGIDIGFSNWGLELVQISL